MPAWKQLCVVMCVFLLSLFFLVFIYAGIGFATGAGFAMAQTKPALPMDKTWAAVAVAKARLEVVKTDAKFSEIELRFSKENLDRYRKLRHNAAASDEDCGIMEQRHQNALANHERNLARVKEAEALVQYAEVHSVADPGMTVHRETIIVK